MDLRPLGDRVIVRLLDAETTTKGGIVLPDTAKEKPQEGEVLAVGNGRVTDSGERIVPEVSVGDKVLFGKYSGEEVKLKGDEYLIIPGSDILAIIE